MLEIRVLLAVVSALEGFFLGADFFIGSRTSGKLDVSNDIELTDGFCSSSSFFAAANFS